ncbi:Uncharacterised protein [Candidatus Tiddalikarchaeum anstoanum]|nr:Uncharacterised protein [Candidatus Tiddalikarchaeum anstoanum]
MRKLLSFLLFCIILSSAFSLSVQVLPIDNSGKPGDVLNYSVTLSEDTGFNKSVLLYMITPLAYSFSPASHVNVVPGTSTTTYLYLNLPRNGVEGRYYETIFFDVSGASSGTQTIAYTIEGPDRYFSLNSVSVPSHVDPRLPFNISLNIGNSYDQITRVYASVDIFQSDGTSLFYTLKVIDTPLGNTSINVEVALNPDTLPTDASIRVNLSWYDLSLGSVIEHFSIIGYARNTTEQISSTSVTSSTKGVTIINNGTIVIHGFDYEVPVNGVDLYFIRGASTSYSLTSDSIVFHVPELMPGESVGLEFTTDYSVLYLLPFLFIGLIYFMYYLTRTVMVSKDVFELRTGLNTITFKVVLKVSNISSKRVNHLRIVEPIAPIISEVFDYGTLHGELKTAKGVRSVVWNLGELKPREELILSYRVRSKIGVVGTLVLDRGYVDILDSSGKVISKVYTNRIVIEGSKREE